MRNALSILLVVFATAGAAVRGDDWMFHRSAYSHSPRWGQEVGANRFSRGPYYGPQYGAYYRGGYRHSGGHYGGGWGWSGDHSHIYESWFQTGEMFSY